MPLVVHEQEQRLWAMIAQLVEAVETVLPRPGIAEWEGEAALLYGVHLETVRWEVGVAEQHLRTALFNTRVAGRLLAGGGDV